MEACFSQLTLDVIGKAVFNYDFNALNTDSPLIQVPNILQTLLLRRQTDLMHTFWSGSVCFVTCQHLSRRLCSLLLHVCTVQAVYTALKETESRATDLLPLWKVP